MPEHDLAVQRLLDIGNAHEEGLEGMAPHDLPKDPEMRMLLVIADWNTDALSNTTDALEEYGARFLRFVAEAGIKVVMKDD